MFSNSKFLSLNYGYRMQEMQARLGVGILEETKPATVLSSVDFPALAEPMMTVSVPSSKALDDLVRVSPIAPHGNFQVSAHKVVFPGILGWNESTNSGAGETPALLFSSGEGRAVSSPWV